MKGLALAPQPSDITGGTMETPFVRGMSMNEVKTKDDINGFLKEMLRQYGWDTEIAWSILDCESKGDPNAHNFSDITRDDSWGLFQINLYGELAKERPSSEWLKIPENNIQFAYEIYKVQGWYAWENCLQLTYK